LAAPATRADFRDALQLRAAISAVARSLADDGRPDPSDIDVINEVAAGADVAPVLAGGRRTQQLPSVVRAFSTIARDAVAVFSLGAGRLRHCGGDNCALIFLDSSRPNARRWCSMQRCGNRTKARIHRSRIKEVAS
jgi:predicted RNA-binding Zn ribbon-like protein